MKFAAPLLVLLSLLPSAIAIRGSVRSNAELLAPSQRTKGRRLDKVSEPKKRECKFKDEEADKVKSECKAKTENEGTEIKDEIEFEVKTTTRGVKVKVEYEQEIEEADVEQESETQFEVYFDSIVEYYKANADADPAYDWENDEVIQTTYLDTWDDISAVSTDGDESTFSVTNPSGNVTFFFIIRQAAQGEEITANAIKVDFTVENWPWQRDDSYLALLSTVETKREIEVEYDDKKDDELERTTPQTRTADILISFDDVADTDTFTPFGEYTWAETAEATTRNTVVTENATVVDTENTTVIETQSLGDETEGSVQPQVATISVVATSPLVEPEERTRRRRRLSEDDDDEDGEDNEDETKGDDEDDKDDKKEKKEKDEDNEVSTKTVEVQSIAFSFVGEAAHMADRLYWDPQAGIGYTEPGGSGSGAGTVSFGLLTGLLSLAMMVF